MKSIFAKSAEGFWMPWPPHGRLRSESIRHRDQNHDLQIQRCL